MSRRPKISSCLPKRMFFKVMMQKMASRYVKTHNQIQVILTHWRQEELLAFTLLLAFRATRWNTLLAYQLARVRAGVIGELIIHPGHGIQGGGLTIIAVACTATTTHIENSTYDNMECMVSHVGHGASHKPKILLGSRLGQL